VAAECVKAGSDGEPLVLIHDLAKAEECKKALDEAAEKFGREFFSCIFLKKMFLYE